MVIRIVKMTFKEGKVDDFLEIFNKYKSAIRNQKGCNHLELWRDKDNTNTFSTYSIWDSEEYLNNYRGSEIFGLVWPATKALFSEKPQASTHIQEYKLD
ncbi:putative quinol monooxygenase [Marivirga arenosa]|uniref:Antibiotic biosynthesis monooxygenase family protein n=1 Tax=Marivirga arenosa TaxID=3059076 RepID=A0AA51ZUW8_9BACT|nr:antibiotic biosynthesis monooxygenase family protein [Marivirga sp. BKB1-2]WNB17203.1 antibiotic biosynthesis monooxygenase family protein [Marivirga sp. BKB1-2]